MNVHVLDVSLKRGGVDVFHLAFQQPECHLVETLRRGGGLRFQIYKT